MEFQWITLINLIRTIKNPFQWRNWHTRSEAIKADATPYRKRDDILVMSGEAQYTVKG